MLMEDGSQGDLDHEAAATVEEEESSSNAGRGSTVMLQVHRGCDGVISKWLLCCWRMATEGSGSRCSGDGGGRRGQQQHRLRLRCNFVAAGGDGSCLQAAVVEVVAARVRLRQREEGQRSALPRRAAAMWSERLLLVTCATRDRCWLLLLVVINSMLAAIKADGSERSLLVAFVPQESAAGCDGSERSLLVVIKSLLVTIKIDGSERSLLATIKEDGSERSLLAVLCSDRSLLVVIKVDGSVCAARDACCG
ncbi:hypothetical protein B296_00006565 [Ensete ventricosum]|uniref:Uncharacterized protein n=1 Tax=Ensete ventricosum TaxID=4639 RepID=A0A427B364_ENSVE|nr:hypothetical protein B296_00006565 [Ensete ventricosum]